jgi:hypothetical protein
MAPCRQMIESGVGIGPSGSADRLAQLRIVTCAALRWPGQGEQGRLLTRYGRLVDRPGVTCRAEVRLLSPSSGYWNSRRAQCDEQQEAPER